MTRAAILSLALLLAAPLAQAQMVPARPEPRTAEGFLSHRATYDLSLKSSQWSANVTALNGRLVSEFNDACQGFTFNQRLVTRFTDTQGKATSSNFWVSTYESADGNDFRFTLKSNVGDNQLERTVGAAARKDGQIELSFESPQGKKMDLPGPMLFPTEFSGQIVAAALAGKRNFASPMFEGDANGKVYDAFVSIGAETTASDAVLALPGGESLRGRKAWPVVVSYYARAEKSDLPEYESSFTLYQNGVTSDVTLDYGDYALSGRLVRIDDLGQPRC